ncbi:MAG TPA: hypothetical protein VHZ26_05880 [Caulobacteraceae bacterium]|nr:hypothetical protein [Caulobacteraceae bacterium]
MAQAQPGPESAIPGAGGWKMTSVPQSGCFARLQGPQADTLLAIGRGDGMVVGAGHPEWKLANGQENATLQIDSGPPHPLRVSPVGNLALVLITDPAMTRQLRGAKRLDWTLPNGRFTAEVSHLGAAFDAILACTKANTPAKAP